MLFHQLSHTSRCIRTMHMCCAQTHDCNKQAHVQSETAGDQPLVEKQINVIHILGVGTNIPSLSPFWGVTRFVFFVFSYNMIYTYTVFLIIPFLTDCWFEFDFWNLILTSRSCTCMAITNQTQQRLRCMYSHFSVAHNNAHNIMGKKKKILQKSLFEGHKNAKVHPPRKKWKDKTYLISHLYILIDSTLDLINRYFTVLILKHANHYSYNTDNWKKKPTTTIIINKFCTSIIYNL